MLLKKVPFGLSAILAASSLLSLNANAQEIGWYLGVNAGQSEVKEDLGEFADAVAAGLEGELTGEGISVLSSSTSDDDEDTAYKLYVGYRFSENFAFEAGYANLGEFNASVNQTITDGVDIADVTVDADIESDGYFFSLLGIAPVSENIEIFAKLGMFFYDSDWKVRYSVTDGIDSLSDSFSGGNSDEEVNWGFGVQYSLDSKWNARLEYERFERIEADEDVGGIESDIDVLSLGIHYSF